MKEVFLLRLLIISWVLINFDSFIKGGISSWLSFANPGLLGSGELYKELGWYLLGGGYILLIALVVALIITYGSDFNILKAL